MMMRHHWWARLIFISICKSSAIRGPLSIEIDFYALCRLWVSKNRCLRNLLIHLFFNLLMDLFFNHCSIYLEFISNFILINSLFSCCIRSLLNFYQLLISYLGWFRTSITKISNLSISSWLWCHRSIYSLNIFLAHRWCHCIIMVLMSIRSDRWATTSSRHAWSICSLHFSTLCITCSTGCSRGLWSWYIFCSWSLENIFSRW